MKNLILRLNNFWFSPLPAARLAILRIVTGCFSLWYLLYRYPMLAKLPENDNTLYDPVGLMYFFSDPFSKQVFLIILLLTIALNICYILGFKFRFTGPLFAVMLLLFFSYRNSWSMIYHNYIALVLHVMVIGFTAAADAFSLDALKKKTAELTGWQYGWPVKLICMATAITYFISGMAKILGDLAWDWVSGNAMRSQVATDTLRKNVMGETTSPMFDWLYAHTWIFLVMGILSMIVELAAPFIIGNKKVSKAWVILALMMHWGIFFIMGIRFYHQMTGIIFLPFLEPEKWWAYLKEKFSAQKKTSLLQNEQLQNKEQAVILFDGVCNFCNNTVKFIINHDKKGYFQFTSLQSATGEQMLHTHSEKANLSSIILLKNDKLYRESTAVLQIAKHLNGAWKLLYVFIILPPAIRNAVYRFVAKNRYKWFGQKESCEIPPPSIRKRFLA
jgi:predicted DCC family thiol-disulfide oxidoreductase YuxK